MLLINIKCLIFRYIKETNKNYGGKICGVSI